RLRGEEEEWSPLSYVAQREYSNLTPGSYTFEVQAQNYRGNASSIKTFAFEIRPPWYASSPALFSYGVVLLSMLVGLVLLPRRRFEKEKAELTSAHQKEQAEQQQVIEATQDKLSHLIQEKLEAEVQHQSQQLATATMHLLQKNESLAHVKRTVEKVLDQHPKHPGKEDLKIIVKELSQEEQFEKDWEQFAAHFDQVHAGFLRRLQESYPQLTPKDTRLCAYLRMNLSTKEIAPLMNISVRGVEISRYRLRKKLDLPKETNLNEFMMNF
ncbi:MAG: triple tyrosine motif-containing protein, partial [Bacteroidota bacterium]